MKEFLNFVAKISAIVLWAVVVIALPFVEALEAMKAAMAG